MRLSRNIEDWHLGQQHEQAFINQWTGGELFVDIGAHIGCWSLKLADKYKKVVAFEPHIKAFEVFKENIQMNELKNIDLHNCALSNEIGRKILTIYSHASHSTLEEKHPMTGHVSEKFGATKVDVDKLDTFQLTPSLIKVDVEGHEVQVIEGALETIKRAKPDLVIELHNPENENKIREMLPEVKFETINAGEQKYLIFKQKRLGAMTLK